MYSGTIGKWKVVSYGSAPTEADIQAVEKEGYEFVSICARNHEVQFHAYFRYRGGRHPNNA
jgi:hypothetical protein